MKFQIQLDDDVAETYQTYAAARPGQTVEQVLAIQLQRYVHADPRLRILLILPEERARLEELTNRIPITQVSDLVARVAALAELSLGRIRFRWTPTQFRQLKERAAFHGMTPQAYAEQVVRQIEDQFFDEFPTGRKAGPAEEIRIKEETARALPPPAPPAETRTPSGALAAIVTPTPAPPPPKRQPPAGVRRS